VARGEFRLLVHEWFDPNPADDIRLGARVSHTELPAAVRTPSGIVRAPEPERPSAPTEPIYRERREAARSSYQIDRQTGEEGRLSYHEPFRPSVAPFKRTHVFDSVSTDFKLIVSDASLVPVATKSGVLPGEVEFFGDITLDVDSSDSVRIPSVAAGMRILEATSEPSASLGFFVDTAENWFLATAGWRGRMRLIIHVAAPSTAFGGKIESSSLSQLGRALPSIPDNVRRAAQTVGEELGVSEGMSPPDILGVLVPYFRGFVESSELPAASGGEALYRQLVSLRHGVCRHRAYAFVVTALGIGMPARFVHNEAHAWVEVFDTNGWRRIDLGGAAAGFDYRGSRPEGPPHHPPPDPYQWPPTTRSASEVARADSTTSSPSDSGTGEAPNSSSGATNAPAATPAPDNTAANTLPSAVPGEEAKDVPSAVPVAAALPSAQQAQPKLPEPAASAPSPTQPPTQPSAKQHAQESASPVKLVGTIRGARDVRRGGSVAAEGKAESERGGCASLRIDVDLVRNTDKLRLGTLLTDERGRFQGSLSVPSDIDVGLYQVRFSTPGSDTCAAGVSD
jgi:hypothetical protein